VACVIAIDAGTSGVRALAVDGSGAVVDVSYRELTQHYPRPGWVEHDPVEIWESVVSTVAEVAQRRHAAGATVAAIGITNQRETVVAWDRATGRPLHRAIVWQDRRTAERCDELRAAGNHPNQHRGGDGLPRWTAADRSIADTDVVLWHTFGVTHIPRPEDWPVMPVEYCGFHLVAAGFFDRNPALDLPPPDHCH